MPLDLLTRKDELIARIPAAFLDSIDIEQAARRISPWLLKRRGPAHVVAAEYLRTGWHKLFSDARVINDERFTAVCKLLDDGLGVMELAWGIAAYHRDCTTNPGRLKNPTMRRTFESWLAVSAETWAAIGADLARQAEQRRQSTEATKAREQFRREWEVTSPLVRNQIAEQLRRETGLPADPEHPQAWPRLARLLKEAMRP